MFFNIKLVVLGTEAGAGVATSWRAVQTWVQEERTRTRENEGADAQANNGENKP